MNSYRPEKGFTLIELMIVMVIIGFMVSLTVVSLGNNPQKLVDKEAKRLQLIMSMAADSAMIEGFEFGFAYSNNKDTSGYQLLQFNADDFSWNEIEQGPLSFYKIDENISIELQLSSDGQSEEVQQRLNQLKRLNNQVNITPSILLLSSGEITPFVITLIYGEDVASTTIESDGISGVIIQ